MPLEEISYTVRGPKLLHEMTFQEVEDALQETDVALVSFGAIEQHGPHLPLGTDAIIAEEILRRVLRKLGEQGHRAVGVLIPIGISDKFLNFPGSITLSVETFIQAHVEICQSLHQQGFRRFGLISGNGGNVTATKIALDKVAHALEAPVLFVDPLPYQYAHREGIVKSPQLDHHAAEGETSKILAARPELVNMGEAKPIPMPEAMAALRNFGGGVARSFDWKAIAPRGYVGDPSLGEAATGDKLYELNSDWITSVVAQEFFARR